MTALGGFSRDVDKCAEIWFCFEGNFVGFLGFIVIIVANSRLLL